jgi:hypothetical protein
MQRFIHQINFSGFTREMKFGELEN